MGSSLGGCISHFFADDLAAIVAGQMGVKYSSQCLDLEKRTKNFLDNLEYYSCLTDQPINTNKTEALFSARAIGYPKFNPLRTEFFLVEKVFFSRFILSRVKMAT
jgi:hypothetical protein